MTRHHLDSVLNLQDFESGARRRLPRGLYDFVAGGAEDGVSLERNRAAYRAVDLVPRVLRDTSGRHTGTQALGHHWDAPFGIAPMGAAALVCPDADLVLARVAAEENIPFLLSGASLAPMERVASVNPRSWFQLYASMVQEENLAVLSRARACGIERLVVTVDVPVSANREQDRRNGYSSPLRPNLRLAGDALSHPGWFARCVLLPLWREGMPHFENFASQRVPMIGGGMQRSHRRDNLDWQLLARLRDAWPGSLIIKGLLDPADARQARALGVDAVVVSNHGGRQLDGAMAPLAALPAMVAAAGGVEVIIDSGVRRGTDVLKALALGADMVLVGRPFLYAAALAGEEGVRHAVRLLKAEVERGMALLGVAGLQELPGRVRHGFGV